MKYTRTFGGNLFLSDDYFVLFMEKETYIIEKHKQKMKKKQIHKQQQAVAVAEASLVLRKHETFSGGVFWGICVYYEN